MLTRIVALFLSLVFSTLVYAEKIEGYWNIEIPVMRGATNISEVKDPRFSTIIKTYDISLNDPIEASQFYDIFFESNGWINWAKGVNEVLNDRNDSDPYISAWSSYHFNVNSNGVAEAVFQLMWNAEKIPAYAVLRVEVNDFTKGKYPSKVKISIVPKLDFETYSCQIAELFKEPKNFFILSRTVKGDPSKIENVDLEHLGKMKNTDPIIEKYYNIVANIMKEYKKFHDKYNR